jgi:DNA polymerase I-like protein with 3'-5' exonuclease and polymerase domains
MGSDAYIYAMVSGNKEDGTDPHTLTKVAGDLESRDIAKNVMYCLLFGGGDTKLAKTAKKPAGTGADLRDKLYRGLDGLGELMERLTKEWRSTARQRYNAQFRRMEYYDGTITGLDGRPIRVPSEHQILVYLLQSDEAIHMAKAYCILCAELEKKYVWGVDYGIVCWYHDEYTIECREEIAQDVKRISEDAIRLAGEYYKIKCPHAGEGAIGKNWYSIH